jgi:phosphatidylserine/phosphatidylglycerophosphate/cardiolipin synthase-like enzyme
MRIFVFGALALALTIPANGQAAAGAAGATTAAMAAAMAANSKRRPQAQPRPQQTHEGKMQVHFSPGGRPTEAIVERIDKAKASIRVQAYTFTSEPIAAALIKAHKRGVDVQVILDKSQPNQRYTYATPFVNAKIPTYIDASHAIAHNKVMIIDDGFVITGSFNFTKAAETSNAENVLVIYSPSLAKEYLDNWERHRQHSANAKDADQEEKIKGQK